MARLGTTEVHTELGSLFPVAALCLFLSCFLVFSVHPYMHIDIVHIVLSEYCSCPVFGHFFVLSTGYQGTPQKAHRRIFVTGRPFFARGGHFSRGKRCPPKNSSYWRGKLVFIHIQLVQSTRI